MTETLISTAFFSATTSTLIKSLLTVSTVNKDKVQAFEKLHAHLLWRRALQLDGDLEELEQRLSRIHPSLRVQIHCIGSCKDKMPHVLVIDGIAK